MIESKVYLISMKVILVLLLTKRGDLIFLEFLLEGEISNIMSVRQVISSTKNEELFLKVEPWFLILVQIILFS